MKRDTNGSSSSKKESKLLTRNERIKLIEEYKNSKKGRRPNFYHDWLYKELENELRLQKRRDNRNKLKIEKKIFEKVVNEGKLGSSDSDSEIDKQSDNNDKDYSEVIYLPKNQSRSSSSLKKGPRMKFCKSKAELGFCND